MNMNRVLWSCVEDALQSLGKSAMHNIISQVNKMGIDITPDNFDFQRFATALQSLFGEGSETIMSIACKNLCKRLDVKAEPDPALPAVERINKILEEKKRNR